MQVFLFAFTYTPKFHKHDIRHFHLVMSKIQLLCFPKKVRNISVIPSSKGQELNSTTTLASQPATGCSLCFIITNVIMTEDCL